MVTEVLIKEPVRSIANQKNFLNRSLLTETRGQSLLVSPHCPLYFPHRVHLSERSSHTCQGPLEPSDFYEEANVFLRFRSCRLVGGAVPDVVSDKNRAEGSLKPTAEIKL